MAAPLIEAHLITAFKSTTVSCTTFHFYYTISHLDEEVEYIWAKRWTAGKIAYLLTRYLGFVFLVLASAGTLNVGWDSNLITSDTPKLKGGRYLIESCLFARLYTGLGTTIITLAEVILMMRIYALFGATRELLVAFVTLAVLLFGFNVLQLTLDLSLWDKGRSALPRSSVKGFGCLASPHMSGVAWTLTAFFEMILFILNLWKSIQLKRSKLPMDNPGDELPRAEDIITLMARDSIIYFAIIFSICLLGAILVFIADESLVGINNLFFINFNKFGSNAYQTIVITIVTILAPKMLINLREEHYGSVEIFTTALSWDVGVAEHSGLDTAGNIAE